MTPWYASRTLWFNAIAALALLLQTRYGFVLDPELQAGLLALINSGLRLITKTPLNWSASGDAGSTPPANAGFARLALILVMAAMPWLVVLAGCATTKQPPTENMQTAGKSLLVVKSAIVTAATATDALCQAHKLDVATCQQAKAAYELSKPSYDSAVDAYLLVSQGGDPAEFGRILQRLQSLIPVISGGAK